MTLMPPTKAISAVDQGELAMQSPQPMSSQAEAGNLGPVDQRLHPGSKQSRLVLLGKARRAEAVDQDAHDDTAARCRRQGSGNGAPGLVILEDVALEVHLAFGLADRRQQRREIFGAAVEQPQAVAGQELWRHPWPRSEHAGRARRPAALAPQATAD
jgi:hypothetical protein